MHKLVNETRVSLLLLSMVILLPISGCINITVQQTPGQGSPPAQIQQPPIVVPQPSQPQQTPYVRKTDISPFNGGAAIIFRLDDVGKDINEDIVERIIRLFGKNNVPLDVGVIPHSEGGNSYAAPFLKPYFDAGIIDISVHGDRHTYMEFDTSKSGSSYEQLKSGLIAASQQFKQYFGITPVAFTVSYDYFNQDGYRAVQDAGFKVFSTQKAIEPYASIYPVDYSGKKVSNGMSRLCTVSDVARWDAEKQQWGDIFPADPKNELFYAIDWGLNNLGVAVVGIHAQAFIDATGKIDESKLNKLDAIVKLGQKYGVITTFAGWYKYFSSGLVFPLEQRKNKTPAYNGGIAVIFRMDDAERGVDEDAQEQIIKLFEQNKVPLDVGVMPYGGGVDSYIIPFLLKYLDAGVIDISVHGYKNTFLEFHTGLSRSTLNQLDEDLRKCFEEAYGGRTTYTPIGTNYSDLKAGLLRIRERFRNYFGFIPAAFTVPYDSFDQDGYRAVQDAGFKIFSSIFQEEPYPSATHPVDYFGRIDKNGLYRLPSTGDVSDWDSSKCKWGDVLPLTVPADPLYVTMLEGLTSTIGLAILRIHPQAFVDDKGVVDARKLNKLDAIVKYVINNKATFGEIITFQSWYEYTSKKPPP